MSDRPALVAAAARALLIGPRMSAGTASTGLPDKAGLYGVFAEIGARDELGLPPIRAGRPAYVGKSEKSLLVRDGQTHFKLGETGNSTLRRSLAALLHDSLELRGQPRTLRNPSYFDKFGLDADDDERLQAWIGRHLTVATWLKPSDVPDEDGELLVSVERALLKMWTPPLNWTDNPQKWHELRKRRRVMADEARAWRPPP